LTGYRAVNEKAAVEELATLLAAGYLRILASPAESTDHHAHESPRQNPLDSPDGQRQELAMSDRPKVKRA